MRTCAQYPAINGSALVFSLVGLLLCVGSVPLWVPAQADTSYTVRYSYDTQGRVTTAEYSTSEGFSYQYDDASNLTGVSPISVLPVELSSFEAVTTGEGSIQLTWTTASETNNAGFRVQRREGENEKGREGAWTKVGSVEGRGTTSEIQRYEFTDADLPHGIDRLEYRLKQVDTDGTTHLTDPVVVKRGAVEVLQLKKPFPNPAADRVTVRYAVPEGTDAESVTMRLFDVLGRVVHTVEAGSKAGRHERQLSVQDLASGVYVLRLEAGGTAATRRLTVVR